MLLPKPKAQVIFLVGQGEQRIAFQVPAQNMYTWFLKSASLHCHRTGSGDALLTSSPRFLNTLAAYSYSSSLMNAKSE